ncbi:MAG: FAS1-like dehydratase domain-containing protein [Nocardioidaceae bacterium]
MPITPGLAGWELPATAPYSATRNVIGDFARAIGALDPLHHDPQAARAAGHPDVVAPVTFPMVIAFQAVSALLADPAVGIELRYVVHAEQRFVSSRLVVAGDVLTARLTVESVRSAAGTDVLATRSEVVTVEGEHVCTASATLAHRPPPVAEQ